MAAFDRSEPLMVGAEVDGLASTPWAWTVHRGAGRFVILRSRPEYRDRAEAMAAGVEAAVHIGRRLRVEVITEDTYSVA
jgi:hypothetical protein